MGSGTFESVQLMTRKLTEANAKKDEPLANFKDRGGQVGKSLQQAAVQA
jgi:hypothetical protein